MKKLLFAATIVALCLAQALVFAAPLKVTRAEDVGMSSERLEYLKSYFEG